MRTLAPAALALALLAPAARALPTVDPALPDYAPRAVQVPEDARYVLPDGSIRIVGADHVVALIARLDERFARSHPGLRFTPILRGTPTAMPALTHGVSLVVPSAREANAIELVPYKKIVGAAPLVIRVAHASPTAASASVEPPGWDALAAGLTPPGPYLVFLVRKQPGRALDPLALEYLRFALSKQGQRLVAEHAPGYLPLSAAEAAAELEKLQ